MTSLTGATTSVSPFTEENAIVVDKWLYDVCGEEDLQFPSHRRQQFASYMERLRRVVKMKQFVTGTFDYPSRSGTREVLVLQRMLEALASREQAVARETVQVQNNARQVHRVLDEMMIDASAAVEEERPHIVSEAAAAALAGAAGYVTAPSVARGQSHVSSPQSQGYVSLDSDAKAGGAAAAATRPAAAPKPLHTSEGAVGERGDTSATTDSVSSLLQAADGADYAKRRALSFRYVSEMRSKTQDMSRQRAEVEQRHARLLADRKQLEKEYEALRTTEELVVARHQEAESHKNEETLRLGEEAAMYAAEEASFDSSWAECFAVLGEESQAPCSTGEMQRSSEPPRLSNEASPLTSSAQHMSSLSPPSYHSSAAQSLSAPSSSTRSLCGEGPGDAAAAPRPDTISPKAAAQNEEDSASAPSSSLSGRARGGGVSGSALEPRATPMQRGALEVLRHRLSEIGARTKNHRRHLISEVQMHLVKFRQSQQRLKEWQDMVAQLGRTHHQLRGQVDVIHTVLSDTAARLEKDSLTAQRAGYGEQLLRLNALLKERSYEMLEYYMGNSEDVAMNTLFDASADEELRALQRPPPSSVSEGGELTPARSPGPASACTSTTPMRRSTEVIAYRPRDNTLSPSACSRTPVREAASNGSTVAAAPSSSIRSRSSADTPHFHRSRYELVRHLQRWESALLAERLAILKAAHMMPGPYNGTEANTKQVDGFSPTHAYQELRALLLQPKNPAAPSA
ncbi:hypothetical protein LSCM1_07028 [Leishmania martiniquensis]|uniref:Uncharacterized protein n=1 Tax=Leishmania martiniquensis TaxID=1580590 RepID=A0A836HEZ5_9TRYP|nr:hypothetical protein LSCM1_07028 [Leishmania martiniquensis]